MLNNRSIGADDAGIPKTLTATATWTMYMFGYLLWLLLQCAYKVLKHKHNCFNTTNALKHLQALYVIMSSIFKVLYFVLEAFTLLKHLRLC